MNIVLLGGSGQLGRELQRSLGFLGKIIAPARGELDLTRPEKIGDQLRSLRPNIVVNAAAYTEVDRAEFERNKAFQVNAVAMAEIAHASAALDAWLVHYSTDYVFDGRKLSSYIETDEARPLNVYGESKLQGENEIVARNPKHLIFRTSWIYSFSPRNFAYSIIAKAKAGEPLKIVSDITGAPTDAGLIADVTATLIYKHFLQSSDENLSLAGIYNLVAAGKTNWYDYAKKIINLAVQFGILDDFDHQVIPINSSEFKAIAQRPLNSELNVGKIENTFSIILPHWDDRLEQFMRLLGERKNYAT